VNSNGSRDIQEKELCSALQDDRNQTDMVCRQFAHSATVLGVKLKENLQKGSRDTAEKMLVAAHKVLFITDRSIATVNTVCRTCAERYLVWQVPSIVQRTPSTYSPSRPITTCDFFLEMSRTEAQMQKSCLAFPCQVPHTVGIFLSVAAHAH
jgi:hypothetical protein